MGAVLDSGYPVASILELSYQHLYNVCLPGPCFTDNADNRNHLRLSYLLFLK